MTFIGFDLQKRYITACALPTPISVAMEATIR